MGEETTCAVGQLLDLRTPEKPPPVVFPSTYTKQDKLSGGQDDHDSSYTLGNADEVDLPVSESDVKRILDSGLNDSIEVQREGSVLAEPCLTPSEIPIAEDVKLLEEEQFDFDIPFSPMLNKKNSLESSTCDQPSGEDDEIFFGPMGHTEKCVSKAVEDVVKEEILVKPLSPLNPKQIVQLFKEAQRVAYHITASAPKDNNSSASSENSSSLEPKSLNFSTLSINDSVANSTIESSSSLSPQPRQRKNTFTKETSSPLQNLSETLNKALPHVDPLPKGKHGALKFSAHGERKKEEPRAQTFARGSAIRRSLPTSLGRGLKPLSAKTNSGLRPPQQKPGIKRPSVGKYEKRIRKDSLDSVDDDALSIASNDSEASYCSLQSGKRSLPQPRLRPSVSGLKAPSQSQISRPSKMHSRSNTAHTPGSVSRPNVESRITTKPTPTRRSVGSQPIGSKLSLPSQRSSIGSSLQKTSSGLTKLNNSRPSSSTTQAKTTTGHVINSVGRDGIRQPQSVRSKLGISNTRVPSKSPSNAGVVSKPSGLAKPAIKGSMTKLDSLKPGALQRKGIASSKVGAGPLKATGLSRPGQSKLTPRNAPKDGQKSAKENTPVRPLPKQSSNTVTKSETSHGLRKVPVHTTPVKAEKHVQPKRLTLQDTTNRTPRKSDSSTSSLGTPVSGVKRRSFLPTPNKTLSVSSTDSDIGKVSETRIGNVGSQGSGPAVGTLVDIGYGSIPDTPSAFMAKPKVLSTPQANKENQPKSIWSPVRRLRMNLEDEVIQCTKRFSVYQKNN